MNRNGAVIVIEDDIDDQEIFRQVFENLNYPNEIIFFGDGETALQYLNNIEKLPFIILSDINMPKLNGFELRKKIRDDADLQLKCIPYLFFTTAVNQQAVINAYSMSVQGFFLKEASLAALQETIGTIMNYWKKCAAPNNF